MDGKRARGEFWSLGEVQEITGLSRRTVTRRVAAGTVPVFGDARDHRKRLVRAADLPMLTEPYPLDASRQEGRQLQPA